MCVCVISNICGYRFRWKEEKKKRMDLPKPKEREGRRGMHTKKKREEKEWKKIPTFNILPIKFMKKHASLEKILPINYSAIVTQGLHA